MTKKELRQKYNTLRNELSVEDLENLSLQLANQSLKAPIWNFTNYHLFLSIAEKKEVNTDFLLQILAGKDKNVILPQSNFETGELIHFLLTDNTKIQKNKYNIPEPVSGIRISPTDIEVVFVPLLAFDLKGHRVGYGKGFYDRFLQQCNPGTLKIGLSLFEPESKITDIHEGDISLDLCITPTTIYNFKI